MVEVSAATGFREGWLEGRRDGLTASWRGGSTAAETVCGWEEEKALYWACGSGESMA